MQKVLVTVGVIGLLVLGWANGAARMAKEDHSQVIASYIAFAEEQVKLDAYGSAIDSYKKVLELEKAPAHYIRLGEIYKMAGQADKEIYTLMECTDMFPKEEKPYLMIIEYFYEKQRYSRCMEFMEKYAEQFGWKDEMIDQYLECKYPYVIRTSGFEEAGEVFSNQELVKDPVSGKWYYLDDRLKKIKGIEFDEASAKLGDIIGVTIDGHPNFVDTQGAKYLDSTTNYEKTWSFVGNRALVKDASGYGFVNSRFELILSGYKNASIFVGDIAAVETKSGWMLIDRAGQQIGEEFYDDVKMDEERMCSFNNRLLVKKNGSYMMIDTEGKQVGELTFEDAKAFNRGKYAAVKQNGKWGFVSTDCLWKIEPQYAEAESFGEDLAAVLVDGQWGYINAGNKMVIEPQFDAAKHLNSNKAPVKQGDLWYYLYIYEGK